MVSEQDLWLSENRAEIKTKINEGYAAAQRGELIDGDEVRSWMEGRKREPAPDRP
jgi:predicted transcriptional regulator